MTDKILLGHGSGGRLMSELIENVIRGILGEEAVQLDDSAVFNIGDVTIAFTTDSFTVSPIFFPGGDIGKLAVNGTVNDLSVMGSKPLFLSCGVIVEEGLDIDVLKRILQSMDTWIWVRSRSQRGCIGCHENRELAPQNRATEALVRMEPTTLGAAAVPEKKTLHCHEGAKGKEGASHDRP